MFPESWFTVSWFGKQYRPGDPELTKARCLLYSVGDHSHLPLGKIVWKPFPLCVPFLSWELNLFRLRLLSHFHDQNFFSGFDIYHSCFLVNSGLWLIFAGILAFCNWVYKTKVFASLIRCNYIMCMGWSRGEVAFCWVHKRISGWMIKRELYIEWEDWTEVPVLPVVIYVSMEKIAILSHSVFIFKIEITPYIFLTFEWQRDEVM